MLDLAFIRDNPDLIKEVARQRNTAVDVDALLEIDAKLRETRRDAEELRAEQNRLSKAIREAGSDREARETYIARGREVAAGLKELEPRERQLESELRGAAEKRLDMLGVIDTRKLHQNAVRPLALNRWLLGSCLVDAPANNLDRLIDCLAPACLGRNCIEPHRPGPVCCNFQGEVRIDFSQRRPCIFNAVWLTDRKRDRVADHV